MKDYSKPTIYGKGCLGVDWNTSYVNERSFLAWKNMLKRCYSKRESAKAKAYLECEVSDVFKNYSLFKLWFDKNYVEGWELDKDILSNSDKVYSSNNCCFIPKEVNLAVGKRTQYRGDYLIGVSYKPSRKQYRARCNMYGVNKHLGWFATEIEAFNAYKQAKEDYIKEVANKWKDQIDPRVYEALMNYQVEITD